MAKKFLTDSEMAALESGPAAPVTSPQTKAAKTVLSDEEMNRLEQSSAEAKVESNKPGWFQPGSKSEAAVRGFSQGATLGFGDEIQAGVRAAGSKLAGDKKSFSDLYSTLRDEERDANTKSSVDNPLSYGASAVAGAAPAYIASGGKLGTVPGAAVVGATQGFGEGKGSAASQITDTAVGMGKGIVAGGIAQGVSSAIPAVANVVAPIVSKGIPEAVKAAIPAGFKEAMDWSGATALRDLLKGHILNDAASTIKPMVSHLTGVGHIAAGAAIAAKATGAGYRAGADAVKTQLAKQAESGARPAWQGVMDYIRSKTGIDRNITTPVAQELFKLNQTDSNVRQALNK